jgi:hypothetical protein
MLDNETTAMNDSRIETALITLARRFAPALVPAGWAKPGDYPERLSMLATRLAAYNHLVLIGDVQASSADSAAQVQRWVEGYVRLYEALSGTLFPSFTQISAQYADNHTPPLVIVTGTATPVMVALAGYIAPYVAARAQAGDASDVELRGLADMMLEDLEAGDLPRDAYRQLRNSCVMLVRQLLDAPVRQRQLLDAHPALAGMIGATQNMDVTQAGMDTPLPPPVNLPEEDLPARPAHVPQDDPFGASIPIFFDPGARGKRPPPVPDLPG